MIDSITTFHLADVLADEPQLQPILDTLAEKTSSFHIAEGALLGSLLEEEQHRELPMIIIRSQRIPDGWPLTVEECDVVLDAFRNDYVDSMCYLTWSADDFAVGVRVEHFDELLEIYPRANQVLVAWVTQTQLVVDYIDVNDALLERLDVAENNWRLSRFVPDEQYKSSKIATFPPPLAGDELRSINGEGRPLYIIG